MFLSTTIGPYALAFNVPPVSGKWTFHLHLEGHLLENFTLPARLEQKDIESLEAWLYKKIPEDTWLGLFVHTRVKLKDLSDLDPGCLSDVKEYLHSFPGE